MARGNQRDVPASHAALVRAHRGERARRDRRGPADGRPARAGCRLTSRVSRGTHVDSRPGGLRPGGTLRRCRTGRAQPGTRPTLRLASNHPDHEPHRPSPTRRALVARWHVRRTAGCSSARRRAAESRQPRLRRLATGRQMLHLGGGGAEPDLRARRRSSPARPRCPPPLGTTTEGNGRRGRLDVRALATFSAPSGGPRAQDPEQTYLGMKLRRERPAEPGGLDDAQDDHSYPTHRTDRPPFERRLDRADASRRRRRPTELRRHRTTVTLARWRCARPRRPPEPVPGPVVEGHRRRRPSRSVS
jgi:hypothetical protein